MIDLINITKSYPTAQNVLDDITLSVKAGEIFGVIGPSGAGKSTLIRCINLLERPTSGRVLIAGKELTQLSDKDLRAERRKIGMIFQHFNLLSTRTVYENVALPLEISGYSKEAIRKTVPSLLDLVGLTNKRNNYPSQLSGGQKQRVAIARALANQPHVLLSDEATSALDPQTTHTTLQLLKKINQHLGVTILLITHEMDVVKESCDRLAIIEHGKIIEESDVLEFFSRPKTETAKQFIRSTLRDKLPERIQQRLSQEKQPNSDLLLRLSFVGSVAQEPLIAQLVQNYHIDINILQANVEVIRDEIIGVMLIQVSDVANTSSQAIAELRAKGIYVELVGYYVR